MHLIITAGTFCCCWKSEPSAPIHLVITPECRSLRNCQPYRGSSTIHMTSHIWYNMQTMTRRCSSAAKGAPDCIWFFVWRFARMRKRKVYELQESTYNEHLLLSTAVGIVLDTQLSKYLSQVNHGGKRAFICPMHYVSGHWIKEFKSFEK